VSGARVRGADVADIIIIPAFDENCGGGSADQRDPARPKVALLEQAWPFA